ncbi:MAG: triose-phosphate isomerase [Chitinophagaceae bacterium]|nr:triose-phosphate isomerase [Chitinophagaceae bacterium]
MRKQIAAANWKMNLSFQEASQLLDNILQSGITPAAHQLFLFAVPFPYLEMAKQKLNRIGYEAAAQNCHHKIKGAYTGEVSAIMLQSLGIRYCIVGHSERREYQREDNAMLAEKVNVCLNHSVIPVFCCGEPLAVREQGGEKDYVKQQLEESLFHLSEDEIRKIIIAYEPVWAIGTGKTATSAQAQDMHRCIRLLISERFGNHIASDIPILYGGSVKASNAAELFHCEDVDGGLVGGASLIADEFVEIMKALK